MKVSHHKKTDSDSDDAKKFNVVIGANSVSNIVGYLLVEEYTNSAYGENNKTNNKSAKIK
ncbi:hypothetical protein IKG06_02865 [Candidatus Saccharibacteria bacterium]|nr:hypothetical protein [Candidatus Saccharibacteria bacterium]